MQHVGIATCSKQLIVGIILCTTDIIEIFEFGEERWMDGWIEGAVECVCKTWFKKQKRGLTLDFFLGAGRLSAFS